MGDEASSPLNSRREFLKAVSLLAISGSALPVTAPASTTEIPRASAPTDLLEEFGYGDVQLAPGLPHSQFEHTQRVMLRMDVDSLLKPYRLRAGLAAPGPGMGGWYDLVSDAVRAQRVVCASRRSRRSTMRRTPHVSGLRNTLLGERHLRRSSIARRLAGG